MRRIAPALALAALLAGTASVVGAQSPASPDNAGLITVTSAHSVPETEKRLLAALDKAGLKVAARIDHGANAEGAGLALAPTLLLIFGNPKAGTVLMEKNRAIGIDLPLKVLIWEANGTVQLAYNDPLYLARRHGLDEDNPVLVQIRQALDGLATAATAQ